MLFVRSDRLRSGSAGHCGSECQRIYDENAFEIVKEGEIVVATAGVVTRANRHEPVADTNIMRVIVVE